MGATSPRGDLFRPFRAAVGYGAASQGVALRWPVAALQADAPAWKAETS